MLDNLLPVWYNNHINRREVVAFMDDWHNGNELLSALKQAGYMVCLKCMGTGKVVKLDDLNDLDTIRFEPCKACGGAGFIKENKRDDR